MIYRVNILRPHMRSRYFSGTPLSRHHLLEVNDQFRRIRRPLFVLLAFTKTMLWGPTPLSGPV